MIPDNPDDLEHIREVEMLEELEARDADRIRQDALSRDIKDFDRTDLGNSERFIRRFGRDIRYCHPQKTWYIWDGSRWARDESGKMLVLAKRTVKYLIDEAKLIDRDSERNIMLKWAIESQAHAHITNMIKLAQSAAPILPEQLDANSRLLNCQNGTLDLDTYKFRKHDREDLCSKITAVRYNSDASCPLWMQHLNLIFGGDGSFIRDFQIMAGYSLLADNPEQIFFILHGSGKNGKTVTVSTLAGVIGDYSTNLAAESLMIRKNAEAPRSDIVKLVGARLITAAESDTSHRLSESLIKSLTGGDTITARTLYQTEREYRIAGKIWFSTNHRPIIKGTDAAIWRRVWLIPFEVTIPEEKRDRFIIEKLAAEGSGILNWMLEGLQRYRQNGEKLLMPERVKLATDAYRTDSDVIGLFINDLCILDLQPNSTIVRAVLYERYVAWCKDVGEDSTSGKTFANRLQERGVTSRRIKGLRYWVGIREKTLDEQQQDFQDILPNKVTHCSDDRCHIDTSFQKVPYESSKNKVLETPDNVSPSVTHSSIPSNQAEARAIRISTVNTNLFTPEQREAIKKYWH